MKINLEDVLSDIKQLAREVGKYQLDKFNKTLNITEKSNYLDLVSEVDKNSEEKIINWIYDNFPEHNIIAEESGRQNKQSEYTWVIDPLDGTTNYIHGFPLFSISIALMKKNEVILGVIYVPFMEELYTAIKDKGAFLNGQKIKVNEKDSLKESLLVTGFPYDLNEVEYNNISIFNQLLYKTRGIRRLGSAAYDLALVASGKLDGFWELKLNPWDIKAGVVIIKEAGGKVIETDINGRHLIIAASNLITDELYHVIKSIYKNK
ncbi:MAG: inositol monophosphatase [Halanaerobiales bacterium]|nr:inositol monophosphatase [Halanaerobiales bacterium]